MDHQEKKCRVIVRLFGSGVSMEISPQTTIQEVRYLIKPNNTKAPKLEFYEESLDLRCNNPKGLLTGTETILELSKLNDDAGFGKYKPMLEIYAVVNKERKNEIEEQRKADARAKWELEGRPTLDLGPKWKSIGGSKYTEHIKIVVVRELGESGEDDKKNSIQLEIEVGKGCQAADLCDDLTRGGPVEGIREKLELKSPTAYRKGPALDRVQDLIDTKTGETLGRRDALKENGVYLLEVVEDITAALCMEPESMMRLKIS